MEGTLGWEREQGIDRTKGRRRPGGGVVLALKLAGVTQVGKLAALDLSGEFAIAAPGAGTGEVSLVRGVSSATEVPAGNHTHAASAVRSAQDKTIAADAVTLSAVGSNVVVITLNVETEALAATDTLATVNVTGTVEDGTLLIIKSANSGRDITITGTSNLDIAVAGNFTLTDDSDRMLLIRWGSEWVELARSDNA